MALGFPTVLAVQPSRQHVIEERSLTVLIVDAKVHSWYSDRPSRPWASEFREYYRDQEGHLQHAGQTNSPEMVLSEMTEVGVSGALLTPVMVYGASMELEFEAVEQHKDKFQVIGVADHLATNLAELLESSQRRGLRGLQVSGLRETELVARGEFDRLLDLCAQLQLVVTLSLPQTMSVTLVELFRRYPDVFFYIDNAGLSVTPPISGLRPNEPFKNLSTLILLSQFENVGVMLTGVPALSFEGYPFKDVWNPITQIIRAFGAKRVSWASDFTRTAGLYSYFDSVRYLAEIPSLSEEQLELVYGGALMERTGWKLSS